MEDLRNNSVALFAAISQVSTWYLCAAGRCVGVHQAMALIGNARQATGDGKSGPVETGLIGPAATALQANRQASKQANIHMHIYNTVYH